jgi:predicted dehydrogenase
MFIDKPVTIKESDALEMMRAFKAKGRRISGGSSLKHDFGVKTLKAEREGCDGGKTLGGFVRAPLDSSSIYGGFYFYAPHLVEVVSEIFGKYPVSVEASKHENVTNVKFNYESFYVYGMFVDNNYVYYACHFSEKTVNGMNLESTDEHNWFQSEFDEFYSLLHGADSPVGYQDFISSVFVMNAIERSLKSGKEEKVNKYEV